ncbi:hypothetical protein KAR48_11640 [bacterium]|nr:hypothetical protein [bacterium]
MISQNNRFNKTMIVGVWILFLASMGSVVSAQNMTADEIIQKNMDACGGTEQWANIKSLKMTGTYTNFSDPESFTLIRQRPDLYRFECRRINMLTVHAYDGNDAWWVNPLMGPDHASPRTIPTQGNLDKVTLRERFFEPVFWNYTARGNQVELIGKEDLDGEEVYNLKVTLKDKSVENWFISIETFLVVSMTGDTYDFGMKNRLETFFSDYREVGGIKLPYLIESEYGIRYRVYEVDEIKLNPEIDVNTFRKLTAEAWKKQHQ